MKQNDERTALMLEDVCKTFHLKAGSNDSQSSTIKALDHVSFNVAQGETFALVGESGSGKTTTARIIAGLEKPDSGRISFPNLDHNEKKMQHGAVQYMFQDPFSALDPRRTLHYSIEEPLKVQRIAKQERQKRVMEIADAIGLSKALLEKLPHEVSGGQRQRVNIARAIVGNPAIVVLDEPVSALDVSVQAQVLNLLKDLQEEFEITFMLITHDMSVVRFIADHVAVMQKGKIVERANVSELFENPQHDYTKSLLAAIPRQCCSE